MANIGSPPGVAAGGQALRMAWGAVAIRQSYRSVLDAQMAAVRPVGSLDTNRSRCATSLATILYVSKMSCLENRTQVKNRRRPAAASEKPGYACLEKPTVPCWEVPSRV